MGATLVTYEYVPLGFEMIIGNTDVEMGKIWNLWWNIKLTDAPETWDTEIKSINKMQRALGELSVDQRLIRAQMAEFCRLHPLFPQSIEILCMEIAEDRFSKPMKMGCEGRGLLDTLGYHKKESLNVQQKRTLTRYITSLEKWLGQNQPETATESKVFGFLGQLTLDRIALVEKLIQGVKPDESSISSLRRLAEDLCVRTCNDFKALERPFNCFKCLPKKTSIPKCQCCHSMFLDAYLLCAGASDDNISIWDKFRRFIEENILIYAVAINSWLKQITPKYVIQLKYARYISRDNALKIAENVHSSLGEKNEVKEWLAACLLKTIKDNQRWHRRKELIDNFPEATSFLKEI